MKSRNWAGASKNSRESIQANQEHKPKSRVSLDTMMTDLRDPGDQPMTGQWSNT